MAETLTESFCERCGTRYEFQAPTRLNPLRKTRGMIGGLRNYLTSQDAFSDAMGDAMRSEEDRLASAQLDAFHETFNFCIGCRQYTCVNCWNDDEGRCRTCAPVAGTDDLAERIMAAERDARGAVAATVTVPEELPAQPTADAWPASDPMAVPASSNGDAAHAWPDADDLGAPTPAAPADDVWAGVTVERDPEPEPVMAEVEPEPLIAEVEPEPEPMVAEVEPEPEPMVAEVEPEPVVAEVEPEPEPVMAQFEPEPEMEPTVAEFEPEPEPVAPMLRVVGWESDDEETLTEPVVAEVEPEPVAAEVEPEPVVAEVEPEPVVAEVEPEPVPSQIAPSDDTILPFPAAGREPGAPDQRQAAVEETPEVAARRAQLDLLGLGDASTDAQPVRPAVLPYRSRGAAPTPAEIAMHAAGAGFWEASAREVAGGAAPIGVQNCGECGLSLSATARFCRRCGTRQAQSA